LGAGERLDADRFGLWLEVLMDAGAEVAAEKLMGLDDDLVIAALGQHVRVFDRAATARDGVEIGGYLVDARRGDAMDAITTLLIHLDAEHHHYFNRVMRGCRELSNEGFELDGLDNLLGTSDQDMYDVAANRDERRERQGYLAAADARAFLRLARLSRGAGPNPIASAYFRSIEWTPPPPDEELPPDPADHATAVVMDVLQDAGVVSPPRALLTGAADQPGRLARIQARMQSPRDLEVFGFVANALMAGCSVQGRALTQRDASEAAAATCNLGLEHAQNTDADLIELFEIGWRILYQDVCLVTARRLIDVLRTLRSDDEEDQSGIDGLLLDLTRSLQDGEPWRSCETLDVIMSLDMEAWAALVGLIAECPVIHAAMRTASRKTVGASDFEFISERDQIASVRTFLESLPRMLRSL
ncbi:MAG TPA: DUF6178 family protein, partial [Vicinamibacterales bacterium]|nr:DUF6178 family protein [Vicinamibacterales bacterium]